MTVARRFVLGWCAAAALVAIFWAPLESLVDVQADAGAQAAGEHVEGELSELDGLRAVAVRVRAADPSARRLLAEECFAVPDGADPALSPDPAAARFVASGTTTGATVLVWEGQAPGLGPAVGSCVGVDRGRRWELANRSLRPDPGAGVASVTWNQYASTDGVAAAAVGRLATTTAEVLVELADGRVLRQSTDGFLAVAWTPVIEPTRIVVVDHAGQIVYDGPVASYR